MFWLVKIGLYIAASWATNKLAAAREKKDDKAPVPSGQADIQAPTVEEGRAIALIWGTCLLSSPNVLWYGNLTSMAIDVGFKYYLEMVYGWCHGPVDAVVSVRWDELEVPIYTTPPGPQVIPYPLVRDGSCAYLWIDSDSLFGGNDQEGGVSGYYDLWWGTVDQLDDEFLRVKIGVPAGEMPAYRGLCYSVALGSRDPQERGFYQGMSAYLKNHAIVARRCPNQLGLTGGAHDIGGDANAACMIYELLTDTRWGMHIPPALIDAASFRGAGEALAADGFGLSMQQNDQTDPEKIISEILRHIDGVIYADPSTGLVTLSLIRDDYDIDELIEIDDDAIIALEEFARASADGFANKIMLHYTDRDQQYQDKVALAVDLAGVQTLGGVVPQDMSFLGISNAALAQRVAARELKGVAYPFASIRLKVNRKAWSLRPGSPFKFSYAPLGIEGMVCRVVRMSLGPITDGVIRIEAVEDAFGVDWTAYSPPAPSQWVYPMGG
jgi:hypothetical protein